MELEPESKAKAPGQPWKRTTAAFTLETLPEECLFAILARLSAPQLSQARLACKTLAAVGKRPDLLPRQEQLQLALTARGDDSRLILGMRQGQPVKLQMWGHLLKQPGARETLRHMAALELIVANEDNPIEYCREMFQAVASCLEGSTTLRVLRMRNLPVLEDDSAALRKESSAGFLRGLRHLDLEECGPVVIERSSPAALRAAVRGMEGLRSLRVAFSNIRLRIPPEGAGRLSGSFWKRGLSLHCSSEPEQGGGPGTGRPSPPSSVLDPLSFRGFALRDRRMLPAACAFARAHSSKLAGLRCLSLKEAGCSDRDLADIVGPPVARGLTALHLAGPGITLEGVRVLARGAGLRCLKELELHAFRLTGEGPAVAGEPVLLQGLTALNLGCCRFDMEGARALESFIDFRSLQTLSLERCIYDESGGERRGWLACVKRWTAAAKGLTSLDLTFSGLEDAEIEEVVGDLANLRELSVLRLRRNFEVPGATISHLACLSGLMAVDLAMNCVGDAGAAILASSAESSSLRRLTLDESSITVEGLKVLTASPVLKELVDLSLANNGLKDEGAAVLAVAPSLGKLTRLCLSGNEVGDSGALALATSSTLRELAILRLDGGVQPTFEGADHLAFSTSLISLQYVFCTPRHS